MEGFALGLPSSKVQLGGASTEVSKIQAVVPVSRNHLKIYQEYPKDLGMILM